MMRRKKIAIIALTLGLVIIAAPFLFLQFMLFNAQAQFYNSYGKHEHVRMAVSGPDFAIMFGGNLGKPSLEKLSRDERLTEEGRREAKSILRFIESGEYRDDMERYRRNDFEGFSWEARIIQRFILACQ